MATDHLSEQRKALPDLPGVYLFRNANGKVIYIGKAKSLKNRIASHFNNPSTVAGRELLPEIERIETVVVDSETEALLVEQKFIQQYRPRFNVRLRDDKSYPCIAVSLDEEFPRVYFTRERHRLDRLYFGPYTSAKRVRQLLDLISKVFFIRSCPGREPGRRSGSPCLDYHIQRCEAPCVGYVSAEDYRKSVDQAIALLSGKYRQIERDMTHRMQTAAENQEYERAAAQRNRLLALRNVMEHRQGVSATAEAFDVIALALDQGEVNAQVLQIREGVVSERQSFYLTNTGQWQSEVVLQQFLLQHYHAANAIPGMLVVEESPAGQVALTAVLAQRRDASVEVHVPQRGEKRRLLQLAKRNAQLALSQEQLRQERSRQQRVQVLDELQEALGMDVLPMRIECFDISTLMGTNTVASMVVFEGGVPKKADYRRFVVRSEQGIGEPDDFAAMQEILERRFAAFERQNDLSPHDKQYDSSFAAVPNVVVIDGGKGQLAVGSEALAGFRARGVAVISLAKRIEEIFFPQTSQPLVLRHDTLALQLLQRVRDEAHRFAITHHRTRRDKQLTTSLLDGLPGVGPKRKQALIRHFGSSTAVAQATRAQLEAVPGVSHKLAAEIYTVLHRVGD